MVKNFRKSTIDNAWEDLNNHNPRYLIESIDLSSMQTFPKIPLGKNLIAFSGLNGVGKSTIINKIVHGIDNCSDNLIIKYENKLSKMSDLTLEEQNIVQDGYLIIDYHEANTLYNFFKQKNLKEYLELFSTIVLDLEAVEIVSYLVGKEYQKIELTIVEEDEMRYPFFKVFYSDEIFYTTLEMGTGEHFLFYLFFSIYFIEEKKLLLLEEPENFISIISQTRIMNWLTMVLREKKASAIIVTHSPIILKNIPLENIKLITREPSYNLSLSCPTSISDIYRNLSYTGTFIHHEEENKIEVEKLLLLVEDKVAHYYLEQLLISFESQITFVPYKIISTNGWTSIDNTLSQSWTKFLGRIIAVFDGDIKTESKLRGNKNYSYTFFPFDLSIEEEFINYIKKDSVSFSTALNRNENEIISIRQKLIGEDPHDYLELFIKEINLPMSDVINILVDMHIKDSPDIFKNFITELNDLFVNH